MSNNKDYAADHLVDLKDKIKSDQKTQLTHLEGCPIQDKTNSVTVGARGPLLVQDVTFTEEMAHFTRERIAERVVHAKGGGALGYFQVTKPDIQKYCKAAIFNKVGKKTPMVARFSTVGGESGSADTVRDPRGFALKFYTEEGNWDLVGNNTPIFFLRDPVLFPSFIHTQKRNPQTHLKDANMFWDFMTLREETTHQACFLFSDRGIPDGFRHMNGYGSHTFKLINDKGEAVYCKFHLKTDQGIKNLPTDLAEKLSASDPDYSLRDLYNAIAAGNNPSWTMYIQVMTYDQAKKWHLNPFDLTKVWPQGEFPLIEVGKMVLNQNPDNYFAQIEQLSFAPSNLVPGIEASPDKMLQGRLFAYPDTARHRLGANFHAIPINRPRCPVMHPTMRDGPNTYDDNHKGLPNYWPNSFHNLEDKSPRMTTKIDNVTGDVDRHDSAGEDNYSQVTTFWQKVLSEEEKGRLVGNIAGHLKNAASFIQERAIGNFSKVDPDFGTRLRAALKRLDQNGSRI